MGAQKVQMLREVQTRVAWPVKFQKEVKILSGPPSTGCFGLSVSRSGTLWKMALLSQPQVDWRKLTTSPILQALLPLDFCPQMSDFPEPAKTVGHPRTGSRWVQGPLAGPRTILFQQDPSFPQTQYWGRAKEWIPPTADPLQPTVLHFHVLYSTC